MMSIKYINLICIVLICVQSYGGFVDCRYLHTRGNTDDLDRLRELLRDVRKLFLILNTMSILMLLSLC